MRGDLKEELQGNSERSQPTETKRWRWSPQWLLVNRRWLRFIVITLNLEFSSSCREKNHSQYPLKYIDVTRSTHTNVEMMQEKRINDYWNVDGDRTLSYSWTGFWKFTLLNEKHPPGNMWSGEAADEDSSHYQTWFFVAAKKQGKQEWAIEKPKLDSLALENWEVFASSIRKTKSFKKPFFSKKKRKKETLNSCKMGTRKRSKELRETVAGGETHPHKKTKCACIVEAHKSTR